MTVLNAGFNKKVVALAATVTLAASSLVAGAVSASAAPGDLATFPTGSSASSVAPDATGTLWVTNQGAQSISKVALDGTTITYQIPIPSPYRIASGSDNNMWFTSVGTNNIGKITAEGATQIYDIGANSPTVDLAQGPDGNMWFTTAALTQVGKITPTGAVTLYDTGGINFSSITPGPQGSNRMYLSSDFDGTLGFITMSGAFTSIPGPQNAVRGLDVTLVNDQVWFIAVSANGTTLTRLVSDSSFTQVSNPALVDAFTIGTGLDGTMWVGTRSTVNHVTTAGAVVATYNAGGQPRGQVQASDGNVWVAVNDGLTRVLTGVVPTSSAAPTVTPATGATAGGVLTATNGTWSYLPTSYSYQWQMCASDNATTCADVAGATGQAYTVATTDVGKYLRVGVRASNLNGPSNPAYSTLVATGAAPNPNPSPNPQPATGTTASIGEDYIMTLRIPKKQKRGTRKFYSVTFTAADTEGTVTFEFTKGNRTKTKTVTISDDEGFYQWRVPRKWRKGRTTVTATFTPKPGSGLIAGVVTGKVRIR